MKIDTQVKGVKRIDSKFFELCLEGSNFDSRFYDVRISGLKFGQLKDIFFGQKFTVTVESKDED